ncbi:uncharacterized protein A4U43_C08F5150 [Asparagus officinalis]|nr:uncharacterized protein A4U43_C08F5150 [Asparagus officinalis]
MVGVSGRGKGEGWEWAIVGGRAGWRPEGRRSRHEANARVFFNKVAPEAKIWIFLGGDDAYFEPASSALRSAEMEELAKAIASV